MIPPGYERTRATFARRLFAWRMNRAVHPERFASFVGLYREGARRAGKDPASLRLGINSHGFIAETSQQAADRFYPPYSEVMTRIGAERGWPPTTREDFDASTELRGANFVGSPQEVIEKTLAAGKKARGGGRAAWSSCLPASWPCRSPKRRTSTRAAAA